MTRFRFAVRFAVTVFTAALLLAFAPAAVGDTSPPDTGATTWALRPATDGDADGRVSLRVGIDPGATARESVALINFSAHPARFAVYASDGQITADGSFDLVSAAEAIEGGGAWIAVDAPEGATARAEGGIIVEVPAEGSVIVPLTISAPAEATPGDHPAGIVAELVSASDTEVSLLSRVGVRAHIRVAGDVEARLSAEDVSAHYTPSWNPFAPGIITVQYVVANAGNIRLGAESDASVAGPFGLGSAAVRDEQREVLPRREAPVTASFEAWPLFFGWGEVTVQPRLVGEDTADAALLSEATPFTVWTVPWAQLALLAIIAAVIAAVFRGRKRSRARVEQRIAEAVAVATQTRAGE